MKLGAILSSRYAIACSLLVLGSQTAFAAPEDQENMPAPQADSGAIIVTGTRTTGMKAADSPTPIQILGSDALQRTGSPDMVQSLAQNLPSIQAQAFGGDLQAHNLQMKLRGLSPNHTLILINGKRRHGTANVAVSGGPFGGGAAPDMSFVLPESVGHVEVLQDGAAAQYGTDAIAGVINFIQKKADHGGSISATAGENYSGGGRTYAITGNIGIAPFDGAYLNVTAQKKKKNYTFRGDINPQVYGDNATAIRYLERYPEIVNLSGYPYTNRILGDPQINQTVVSYNAGYEFNGFELYSFGSYGHKVARAHENVRTPDVIVAPDGTPFYPSGFQPQQRVDETDYSFTGGFRGMLGETSFDVSSTYGKDIVRVYVDRSGNAQLYYDTGFTPTSFHNGNFVATQWSNTLDLTHPFEIGLAEPLTVAAGIEYRRESYEIVSGDPASYYGGGAQSFFGYSPNDAGFHKRTNFSQYLDLSVKPTENWLVNGAVRHEHYSDFGDTTVFKLTSRYDFSDAFALRGTVSTGFRAPTLAEGFYSGINVSPSGANGVLPSNSASAKALGFGGLGPEKSTSFSLGVVFKPAPKLNITIDAYQIDIRNRIVISSSFYGFRGQFCPAGYKESGAFDAERCNNYDADTYALYNQQAVLDAVAGALGGTVPDYVLYNLEGTRNIDGSVSVQTFVNGVKMRTRGIDFLMSYSSDFGDAGTVDWSLTANYNENKVRGINALPSALYISQVDPSRSALIDHYSVVQLEESTPKFRATAGAYWKIGKLSFNLRESFYSSVKSLTATPGNSALAGADTYVKVKSAFITDLEATYKIAEPISLSIGANNLFDKFPTKTPDLIRQAQLESGSRSYSSNTYPTISPFGINGGYYYARVNVSF